MLDQVTSWMVGNSYVTWDYGRVPRHSLSTALPGSGRRKLKLTTSRLHDSCLIPLIEPADLMMVDLIPVSTEHTCGQQHLLREVHFCQEFLEARI